MKTLKELYDRLYAVKHFEDKYPEFNKEDGKIHVLFLSACLNESGYYRLILPALELNKTETHAAIIASIHKWDFNKLFDDYDNPVDFRLIEWADYIVLPAMFSDVSYIVKTMKQINDDLEFVMDLEVNYHELPEYHPDAKKLNAQLKEALVSNLSKVDMVTAPNNGIINYYHSLLQERNEDFLLYFERYHSLLSHYTFEEIEKINRNVSGKVRIGIIADASQGDDLKIIEKVIDALLEQHSQIIEIIVFGWSKKIAEHYSLFNNVKISYEKPVPFYDYHSRLNSLGFDIGLLPFVDNDYNSSGKAFNRFLDFSTCMIPMVAPKMLPLEKLIREGDNGFIANSDEEWIKKTGKLINDAQLRKDMGEHAFNEAWENYAYSDKTLQRLKTIFI